VTGWSDPTWPDLIAGAFVLAGVAWTFAAGVAHAAPSDEFVSRLARHGIRNTEGPAQMVQDGHEVCEALDRFSFAEEVARIRAATNLDPEHAAYFVRLSRDTYCPRKEDRT